jgi:hypothetical protein
VLDQSCVLAHLSVPMLFSATLISTPMVM